MVRVVETHWCWLPHARVRLRSVHSVHTTHPLLSPVPVPVLEVCRKGSYHLSPSLCGLRLHLASGEEWFGGEGGNAVPSFLFYPGTLILVKAAAL